MTDVIHISIAIECTPEKAYAFAANPENLPQWAAGLAQSRVSREGNRWRVRAPFGEAWVTFAAPNAFGVMDHDVVLEDGTVVHNPMRVVANGSGSEFIFTLFRQPGMSDEQFAADRAAVEQDLATLKTLLEKCGA